MWKLFNVSGTGTTTMISHSSKICINNRFDLIGNIIAKRTYALISVQVG